MAEIPGQIFDFTTSDSSLIGMLQKINSFTDVGQGGIFGIFILLIVGGGLTLMLRGNGGNERAFSVASIVTVLIAVMLRIIGLIGDKVLFVCLALFVIGVIYLLKEQGQYE